MAVDELQKESYPEKQASDEFGPGEDISITLNGEIVNSSGHRDQLQRGYGFLSICGLALSVDNAWVALGTSLTIAIYNGGAPGVLYELLVAGFYYSFIGASLAELASSIPSAGGVYHWSSVAAGPRHGRAVGFFTGFINFFGWLFDLASIVYIMSELVIQMYAIYHPNYTIQPWHIFVTLTLIVWICICVTIFLNRYLPIIEQFGLFVVLFGGLATIITLAVMPKKHASHSFVWTNWDNETGWSSGVAFLTGVLNGAFTIGTPDAVTHMAEELPNPKKDLPKAIAAQLGLGTLSAFLFAVALLYGISDITAVQNSPGSFPLAAAYAQATGSNGATFGLLFIIFLSLTPCLIGTFLTVGRTFWALARDNATPFPGIFGRVNEKLSCPVQATLLTGLLTNALGAITLGSKTAFSDLAGSFVILSTTSYALCFIPNMLTGRRNIPPGAFWMGKAGYVVNGLASLFIILFNIMFCFPYALPTTVASMNYNSVILVGVLALTGFWWLVHGLRKYPGPKLVNVLNDEFRRHSRV